MNRHQTLGVRLTYNTPLRLTIEPCPHTVSDFQHLACYTPLSALNHNKCSALRENSLFGFNQENPVKVLANLCFYASTWLCNHLVLILFNGHTLDLVILEIDGSDVINIWLSTFWICSMVENDCGRSNYMTWQLRLCVITHSRPCHRVTHVHTISTTTS